MGPKSVGPGGWVSGTKFFSRRATGRTPNAGGDAGMPTATLDGRDRQQALVLDALRRAAGAPVSYAELRAAGIELPASVVSELELAGVAIERCVGGETGLVGVRLDPANAPTAPPTPDPGPSGRFPPVDRVRPKPSGKRAVAPAALVAGAMVIAAVVVLSASGGGRRTAAAPAKRIHSPVTVATSLRPPPPRQPTNPAPQVPVSPALATQLEAQGHSLLEAGRYGVAVPVLRRAVLATGENVGACLEPANSTCLIYAYALYDLGRAERLNGEPQAAVPILERRLQIDNQRSTVGAELQLARQGIS
ncbi:MAG TPA: tetratricopeptide repeat protein [Solirubrobacteraceae bacterium]|nr:tetratricopeptide repeat protein [Solirubrobacteraceae bacterium]